MSALGYGIGLRAANVLLGTWLIASSFLWPHTVAQQVNAIVVALLAIAFAVAESRKPKVRYLNIVLAIWLFVSTLALPGTSTATLWNALFVAIMMVSCTITPREPDQLEVMVERPAH